MVYILIALIVSALVILTLIRYDHLHQHISFDPKIGQPQKIHKKNVSRIGGLGICLGCCVSMLFQSIIEPTYTKLFIWYVPLIICVYLTGFTEDITKKISPNVRMLALTICSFTATYYGNLQIQSVDIGSFNLKLSIVTVSLIFTTFAITGLINAYNIIDGFNGLASMTGIIALLSISYVAFKIGDIELTKISLVVIAAILGFFIWNYPHGYIFLGDGGAYIIGFQVAALSILLVNRNDSVSNWFPILINAYPIYETLFTIWRRKFIKKNSPTSADGIHFHSIIYRRVLASKFKNKKMRHPQETQEHPLIYGYSLA